MPRLSFEGLKDPQVVHHFALEVQGIEEATFREATGFESSHDVIEHREVGKGGKQYISKQPGNLKWADIVLKRGVCQDYAHVFIACARHLGIPARYIGGHFLRSDGVVSQEAGHAWAEVYVADLGWVAFDPTNGISTTDAHVRVAVGLDYLGAAPVRGTRIGGAGETLAVKVHVDQAGRQTQS